MTLHLQCSVNHPDETVLLPFHMCHTLLLRKLHDTRQERSVGDTDNHTTVEPLNKGHVGTRSFVLYREVSFIRRLKCTGIIGIGTSKFVFYREVSFINPRRACAARVTVVGLCVRPSVRPSVNR